MNKRIFVTIMVLIMCIVNHQTLDAKKKSFGKGFYWELSDDGVLTITGKGEMPQFKQKRFYTKTPWLKDLPKVRSVIIGEGITTISMRAFYSRNPYDPQKRSSIEKVILPSTLKEIGAGAFLQCMALQTINIPEGVMKIDDKAFDMCDRLSSLTLPESLVTIGEFAFASCPNLEKLFIPNSVTFIGKSAFWRCKKINSINIPNSLHFIEDYTFYGLSSLKYIAIPQSVTHIGAFAFAGSGITSLIIPSSVEQIDNDIIYECSNLKAIKVSPNIKQISKEAFYTYEGDILQMPSFVIDNYEYYGLSSYSVENYKKGIFDVQGNLVLSYKKGRESTKLNNSYYLVEESGNKGIFKTDGS